MSNPNVKFFKEPKLYKQKYFKEPIFGYFGVEHKESFRLLTGSRLKEHKFPNNFEDLTSLITKIDSIMESITLILSPTLFPNIKETAKKFKIPFFDKNRWGMFDIAKYHNDGSRKTLNCKEHYDPGLLSLSLRSSEEGLQLKDEFGKWIKAPIANNIAILWAGKAATDINPKIKPGVHRVSNPLQSNKSRIAIWHEICTTDKEHKELIKNKRTKSYEPKEIRIPTYLNHKRPFRPMIYKTRQVNPYKFESSTGISMSKSLGTGKMF
jgi:hypothetical protein